FFYFFFQAEDGIRDLTVTGVQTCALPIFLDAIEQYYGFPLDKIDSFKLLRNNCPEQDPFNFDGFDRLLRSCPHIHTLEFHHCPRSEERRVGKECRSRWLQYHYKKI